MRVLVIGAGQVGTNIAASLSSTHDVIVVDIDEDRTEQLAYDLDVLTLTGDGTDIDVLREADIDTADMVIASTDDDEINLVACATAKTESDPFTIARVKSHRYLRSWEGSESAYGVDFMVCSDLQTAKNIVEVVGLPAAVNVGPFAGGLVQMAEFEILPDSPIAGQVVAEADRFDSLTFAAIFRADRFELPSGETPIRAGDNVVVIGSPESVQEFASSIVPAQTPDRTDDLVVVGGSEIGYHTARLLEQRGLHPKLIEQDDARARELAEELPNTLVMEHDATDTEFLAREHIDDADAVVATLDSDQKNLLLSVLAKRIGVDRIITVVDTREYIELFQEIGIDVAINPRFVMAEEITRFTHEGIAENIAVLEEDLAEVLELEMSPDSQLVGRPIRELIAELPKSTVIGAVTRDHTFITPRGDTVLEPGDHVVVFVEADFADDITAMS
ncbi:Trk system potassium transporter TrkA [Halocatena salina]|uniref:Trk system potassium transporter TrkA n=1 Tax=Halocatena salina TaxID=2934340 RepID=A0A8U0A0G4_9EURY|nr:Trk system potassium transporter TrkA [Halocatena salina]UPM42564.1 Trk system potassium transporter TrkA [Halocatena salina]